MLNYYPYLQDILPYFLYPKCYFYPLLPILNLFNRNTSTNLWAGTRDGEPGQAPGSPAHAKDFILISHWNVPHEAAFSVLLISVVMEPATEPGT